MSTNSPLAIHIGLDFKTHGALAQSRRTGPAQSFLLPATAMTDHEGCISMLACKIILVLS